MIACLSSFSAFFSHIRFWTSSHPVDTRDSGSLSSLTFSGAKSKDGDGGGEAPWVDGDSITINTTMTEANFSGKGLGHLGGAQVLAAFMSTKLFQDKGSLSSLDVSNNQRQRSYDRTSVGVSLSYRL